MQQTPKSSKGMPSGFLSEGWLLAPGDIVVTNTDFLEDKQRVDTDPFENVEDLPTNRKPRSQARLRGSPDSHWKYIKSPPSEIESKEKSPSPNRDNRNHRSRNIVLRPVSPEQKSRDKSSYLTKTESPSKLASQKRISVPPRLELPIPVRNQSRRPTDLSFKRSQSIELVSDDSENELDEPIFNIDRSQPSAKIGWFTWFKKTFKEYWDNTFFLYLNQYFGPDYEILANEWKLPDKEWQAKYHVFNFQDNHDKLDREEARRIFGGNVAAAEHYFQSVKYDVNRQVPLMKILFMSIKAPLAWAIFFRIISQLAIISIPLIMNQYLTTISNFERYNIFYSILYCLAASQLSFWAALWGIISWRNLGLARGRAMEEIREAYFIRLLDANIEFSTKAGSGLVTKMLLFDMRPIMNFFSSIVAIASAPISITYAFVMIFISFRTNQFVLFILAYLVFMIVVIFILHHFAVIMKNKYRSISSRCAGYLDEMISKAMVVKANSLQSFLMRKVWNYRREQERVIKYLHIFDSVFDVIFSSPILISALVMFSIQETFYGGHVDSKKLFTIIGTLNALKGILGSLSDSLSAYQDYRPSINFFYMMLNQVPRTPKIALLRIDSTALKSQKKLITRQEHNKATMDDQLPLVIQKAHKLDSRKVIMAASELDMNFAVLYEECTFVDKSNAMSDVLNTLFMENYLQQQNTPKTVIVENMKVLENLTLRIRPGQKVCVMGKENLGFQLFLNSLSNELDLEEGKLYIRGKVNHFDLNRFELLDESFLENIVLDTQYNRRKFDKICLVLDLDLKKYAGRELGKPATNVNLTFFDQVKILLARALYQNFDIFVISCLFDRLSYEDRLWFFDRLILQYLKFTTVFYQASDVALIKKADYVLVFKDYNLVERGTYDELNAKENSYFKNLINQQIKIEQTATIKQFNIDIRRKRRRNAVVNLTQAEDRMIKEFKRDAFITYFVRIVFFILIIKRRIQKALSDRKSKLKHLKITGEPILSKNIVTTYLKLLRINGRHTIYVVLLIYGLDTAIRLFWNVWIGWWASDYFKFENTAIYFQILIGLSVLSGLYVLVADAIFYKMMRSISSNIFYANVKKFVKAELRWFKLFSPPVILYYMFNYQNTVDDYYNQALRHIVRSMFMITVSLIISNIFYPGIFFVITVLVVWYAYHITRKMLKVLRVYAEGLMQAYVKWYTSYLNAQLHAVPMRFIGKGRYMFRHLERAFNMLDQTGAGWGHSARWLGIRTAMINGFLVFWVYLCPVIMTYWPIYDFKNNIWLLGLVLTWSNMSSSNISSLMDSIVGAFFTAEESERVLELQRNTLQTYRFSTFKESKNIKDELEDEDLVKLFMKKSEPYKLDFSIDKRVPIIQFLNVSSHTRNFKYLYDVSFDIFCGDKVAMIDDNSTSVPRVLNLILGFQNPDSFTNKDGEDIKSVLHVFGRDVTSVNKYHMRLRMMYLSANPTLMTGTLRDNIDPFRMFLDEEIVRVLHYLGFYNAYCSYSNIDKTVGVENLLENLGIDSLGDNWKLDLYSRKRIAKKKVRFPKGNLDALNENELTNVPPVVYYSTPIVKNAKVLRKLRIIAKLVIMLRRLMIDVRTRERVIHEDLVISKEINYQGYISKEERKYFEARSNAQRKANVQSLYKATHELLASRRQDVGECKLLSYHIEKSNERAVLHNMLRTMISTEARQASLNMRRIIQLTRALLERPDILILDEDSLLLEEPNDSNYLTSFFVVMKDTTMICKMQSYKLIHRFDKCATFSGPRLVEYEKTKKLITDTYSYTATRIFHADARKLPLCSIRRRNRLKTVRQGLSLGGSPTSRHSYNN